MHVRSLEHSCGSLLEAVLALVLSLCDFQVGRFHGCATLRRQEMESYVCVYPAKFSDFTVSSFLLWGHVRDKVLLPVNSIDMKDQITSAISTADVDILRCLGGIFIAA